MDWTQVLTIAGTNIALIAVLSGLMVWMANKLDGDIKSIGTRLDDNMNAMASRQDAQSARLDQLYTMFVDLLKERNSGK